MITHSSIRWSHRACPCELTDEQRFYRKEIAAKAETEICIRQLLGEAEGRSERTGDNPVVLLPQLRCAAVVRMAVLEADNLRRRSCKDTEEQLRLLIDDVGASTTVARQLAPMYCVQRTAQFLGGHDIDPGDNAIRELGVWTMLAIRWPLLAEHLSTTPDHVSFLREQVAPDDVSEELQQVFVSADVAQFLFACEETALTAEQIRRFARPIEAKWTCRPVTLAG